MPGPRGKMQNPADKAKDFKGAIKRLFEELDKYKIAIVIALILAMLGAIMFSMLSMVRLYKIRLAQILRTA